MKFSDQCTKMNYINKDQQDCDVICRNHSAKSERDLYRVSPSTLSKRELENLYYALLDNNLDLKKTLHSQQDKLKILSTKLQRMTVVQRNAAGKEKNCCPSKVLLNEQKEVVAELKKANEQMADKIRILNMRLCSTKQFLKRSPSQIVRCPRCANVSGVSAFKNSSMSAFNVKHSETNVKMNAVSCQYLSENAPESNKTMRTVETETDLPEKDTERSCNENKCRNVMDELKQKIVNLEEELSRTHNDYSNRVSKLQNEVSDLRNENLRVRSKTVESENVIQLSRRETEELRGRLREAGGMINDLTMQLSIEKRRVVELETTLKLTNTSSQMVQIIEKLNTFNQQKPQPATEVFHAASLIAKRVTDVEISPRHTGLLSSSPKAKEDAGHSKSDDSGCTDLNKSSEAEDEKIMDKINQEMLKRISDLQTQLDTLGIKAAGESTKLEKQSSFDSNKYKDERQMAVIPITDDRPNVVSEAGESTKLERHSSFESNNYKDVRQTDDRPNISSKIQCMDTMDVKRTNSQAEQHKSTSKESKNEIDPLKTEPEKKSVSDNSKIENKGYCNDDTCPKRKDNSVKEATNEDIVKKNGMIAKNDGPDKKLKADQKHEQFDHMTGNKNLKNASSDVSDIYKNNFKKDYVDLGHSKVTKDNVDNVEMKQEMKIMSQVVKEDVDSNYFHQSDKTVGPSAKPKTNTEKTDRAYTEKTDQKCSVNKDENGSTGTKSTGFHRDSVKYSGAVPSGQQNSARRDSTTYNAEVPLNRRDSTTYNAEVPLNRRDSSTYNAEVPLNRRDSSTYNAEVPLNRQDFTTYNAEVPLNRRDSTTYNAEVPLNRRDSTTYNADASPARRNSTTCNAEIPLNRRNSTIYNAEVPLYRQDSTTYNAEVSPTRRNSTTYNAEVPNNRPNSATYTAEAPPLRQNSTKFTKSCQPQYCKYSRDNSPANTEHEISSLSDLPPERDGKSPAESPLVPPSPGEAVPSPDTDTTRTSSHTDYGTLSEGEVPTPVRGTRYRKLSIGEKATYIDPPRETSNAQMEATLEAISTELARCRQLLTSSRPEVLDWSPVS